jgi:hypothetical protein
MSIWPITSFHLFMLHSFYYSTKISNLHQTPEDQILKQSTFKRSTLYTQFAVQKHTDRLWSITSYDVLLLLQSALQPLVGFRPAQLLLSILRMVLQCCCQRHVKPPTWRRTRDLEHSNFCHKRPPASQAMLANPAAEGGSMGEKWPRILPKVATSMLLLGSFTCRKARHGTDSFTSPPKEGVLRIFSPKKSNGFGLVWTRELGYQRPARNL